MSLISVYTWGFRPLTLIHYSYPIVHSIIWARTLVKFEGRIHLICQNSPSYPGVTSSEPRCKNLVVPRHPREFNMFPKSLKLRPQCPFPDINCLRNSTVFLKLQLHDAIYRLRFYLNSLIRILSLSNSHNNVASIQKNRGDKSHRVIVALNIANVVGNFILGINSHL